MQRARRYSSVTAANDLSAVRRIYSRNDTATDQTIGVKAYAFLCFT